VVGGNLAVDEQEALLPSEFHEVSQRHLGSLGFIMEHGLPEKGCAQRDSVESSHELAVSIALEGMSEAIRVEI